jgi:CRISPR-associated protein Csa3
MRRMIRIFAKERSAFLIITTYRVKFHRIEISIVIIAVTFGFDEKFAIRALMRHPPSDRTRVVVLLPEEGQDERVERGLSVLNDFVKRYVSEEGVELVKVPVVDFRGSVLTLARTFRTWAERPIILNLSGGMRLLVVEVLCAALISKVPMTVEVESEDGKALAAFSTTDLSFPETDEVGRQIIESLSRGVRTLGLLSEELGISKPTVWRRLKRLESAGMVQLFQGKRREVVVPLTECGRIYSELLSG